MRPGPLPQSDVRIHCDNDNMDHQDPNARWVPYPDIPNQPAHLQNSAQPFERKWYYDQINLMYRPQGSAGVQDDDGDDEDSEDGDAEEAMAQTYTLAIPQAPNDPNKQNGRRSVITVCIIIKTRLW